MNEATDTTFISLDRVKKHMHHINSSEVGGWIINLLNKSHLFISGENSKTKVGICIFGSGDGAGIKDNVGTNEERGARVRRRGIEC